jgi:GT2 family glycosyltransferase/DNA-binding beta-propeller fold protein YncE
MAVTVAGRRSPSETPGSFARDDNRPRADGKFIRVGGRRFLVKGVAYGTFAPDDGGAQFPAPARIDADFAAIAAAGFNTIRTYTVPSLELLDTAARHSLRVLVGLPWPQHQAFLDDARIVQQIRRDAVAAVRDLFSHPAALMFAVGNEIPPAVVRWHGRTRIERFLRSLYEEVKSAAPDSLITYVNFPPTDYLDLDCFDVCAVNVFLHREADLRAYLSKLQHIAATRPLLVAEAGVDSLRKGQQEQARIAAMQVRAAFAEGACGAVAFSWTDEWWRGGTPVSDWAFGLVDANRRPKPALAAVAGAFADAPFPPAERASWPRVSVVVCAYNAADTLDDCLTSLAGLSYPDVEIIVVNDGSRDATGTIARRYAGVRVIDIPNGGLSAGRNAGLAAATGEIVAYTDADVRVDPDWLTYLVQPFLRDDVAATGGPNLVPPDDGWMAQCVARAPGGPTHVLIDDRIAEHVPGCNMAFRRDVLLSIGGFNPVFLRAGDDVDICWRLQAQRQRIGFAPSALVWHHHRTSIEAFWRQQVGYGEGEAWLTVHHPEKFTGGRARWRGRIYAPLPLKRELRASRVNTGMWGTAAFPSVYWPEPGPWQWLPHSPSWMALSTVMVVLGLTELSDLSSRAAWLLLAGAAGWATTVTRCALLAWRTTIAAVAPLWHLPPAVGRVVYRVVIAWLHLIQPLARLRGRLRGIWSLPQVAPPEDTRQRPWQASLPSWHDVQRSGRLIAGGRNQQVFWSESWLAHTSVLASLVNVLRASRPAPIVELDEGWHADRDVSIAVGHWGWIDVHLLVEEHAGGRCLLRLGKRLRLSPAGLALALTLAVLLLAGISATIAGWAPAAVTLGAVVGAAVARAAWQAGRVMALVTRGVAWVAVDAHLAPLGPSSESATAGWRLRPIGTGAIVIAIVLAAIAGFSTRAPAWPRAAHGESTRAETDPRDTDSRSGNATFPPDTADAFAADATDRAAAGGGVAVGIAGDLFVVDPQHRLIQRLRPRPPAGGPWSATDIGTSGNPVLGRAIPIETAADIVLSPQGDLFVADARHHRIRRIVPSTGGDEAIAGAGTAGFAGDSAPARLASLNGPSGLALARNGDLYVADTMNHRIRVIERATGVIRTVAGDGRVGAGDDVGDGQPATVAHLHNPTGLAVDLNGDLYIADSGHHRIRKITKATGRISTIAGDGTPGDSGDEGPAVRAQLASPIGIALASGHRGLFVYVADSRNNRIRVIDPDGRMTTLESHSPLIAPTRVAYHPAGWLYVKDGSPDGVTALFAPASRPVAGDRTPSRGRRGLS